MCTDFRIKGRVKRKIALKKLSRRRALSRTRKANINIISNRVRAQLGEIRTIENNTSAGLSRAREYIDAGISSSKNLQTPFARATLWNLRSPA